MTGWRTSVGWKLEDYFAVEKGTAGQGFEYLGPGMDFTYTPNNKMNYVNTLGTKFYDVSSAGRFSGSWSANVLLDYNHFKWLMAVFEDYHYDLTNQEHVFRKSNRKIVRSFSVKALKLNRIVYSKAQVAQSGSGTYDQYVVLLGCVITSFTPSYESSSGATVKCAISGTYADEYLMPMDLDSTEYDSMEPNSPAKFPVEWGCLQIYDNDEWVPIANNERTGFTLSQTINTLPSCGTRFDSAYYDGSVSPISITSQVYSRNPKTWYLRVYSGGEDYNVTKGQICRPYAKSLKPIDKMRIVSTSDTTGTYSATVDINTVTVESMRQSFNANSAITDAPTLKARSLGMRIKTPDIPQNLLSASSTKYTATLALGSGTSVNDSATSQKSGVEGDTFTLPTASDVTYSGHTLNGWSSGGKTYAPGTEVAIGSSNMTYTAVWS